VFALFAAGISVSPGALLVRLTKASLDPSVTWSDLFAVAVVAGIGFTVSLLIGELSLNPGSPHRETVKAVVLLGSATAAALGATLLSRRSHVHRGWHTAPGRDSSPATPGADRSDPPAPYPVDGP